MCYFLPVVAAIGAVVSAAGTVMSAQSQSQAAQYQAKVAQNNAIVASQNAQSALSAGTAQAQQQLAQADQRQGQIRASLGANNIEMSSGSALDIQSDAGRTGALNAYTTQYNAGLQAAGFRAQGTQFQAQATADNMASSNDATAGTIGGFSSLLSSASSFAPKWAAYQQIAGTGGAAPLPGGLY